MILQDPIETGDHRRYASRSIAIQNPYRNESHRFRGAVIGSADDARHMRSMTVTVVGAGTVCEGIEARNNPAAEIIVPKVNAFIAEKDPKR